MSFARPFSHHEMLNIDTDKMIYSEGGMRTKFDIYVFITTTGSIPLLVDY